MPRELSTHRRLVIGTLSRVLAYLWAAPNSLIGLLFALVALALGARLRLVSGNVELCGGALGRLVPRVPGLGRYSAITFGHVILAVNPEAMASCRAHEQEHVRQCERWGPIFLPAYFLSSLWQVLCGRSAYSANHFERQVYASDATAQSPREAKLERPASHHRV